MIGGMWGRRGRVNNNARGLTGKRGDPRAIHCDERLWCLENLSRGGADGGQTSKCTPTVRVVTGSARQVEKHALN